MVGILIFMILALAGLCIIMGEDLVHKTSTTVIAWCVIGFLLIACFSMIFMFRDEVRRETIIDYEQGKYYLETQIQCDTTYFVKKCKE